MLSREDLELAEARRTLVLFGATGDLSRRRLIPALHDLAARGLLAPDTALIATAPDELSTREFAARARATIQANSAVGATDEVTERFVARLRYIPSRPGLRELAEALSALDDASDSRRERVLYLAVPPAAFAGLTEELVASGVAQGARVVFEKPFGCDPATFASLRELVRARLGEQDACCIDHFLAKEAVRRIMLARFADSPLASVWNRDHIDHVVIDAPETLGIGSRGGFYDRTGALRDMVVTHMFNLLAAVAMPRPASLAAADMADARIGLLRDVRPLDPAEVVRGQYDGYRDLDGVSRSSNTETYFAARVAIDNNSWSGVPFIIRTGKRLESNRQAVRVAFTHPVAVIARDRRSACTRSRMVAFDLRAGEPSGRTGTHARQQRYPAWGAERSIPMVSAYERVMLDVLGGRPDAAIGFDAMARSWEIVTPVLADPPGLHRYQPGSAGPEPADALLPARSVSAGAFAPGPPRMAALSRPREHECAGARRA